jgi:copper(I)-binding protein
MRIVHSSAVRAAFGALALSVSSSVLAHDWRIGEVRVVHPVALATVPGQKNGAIYLTLENRGREPARLVRASVPVAERVEFHSSSTIDNVMRMREIDTIDIKPGGNVKLRPGDGIHLMLVDLRKPLADGDRFPLTVEFANGARGDVTVWVQKARGGKSDEHKH